MADIAMILDSDHTQPWLLPAGKFILNFGILELMASLWIGDLSADDIVLELASEMPLSKRLTLITALVKRGDFPAELEQEALDLWARVGRLSKMRNGLAHGPIMYGWHGEDHSGSPDFIGCLNVRKFRPGDDLVPDSLIEFSDLCAAVDESAQLSMALGPLLDKIRESLA